MSSITRKYGCVLDYAVLKTAIQTNGYLGVKYMICLYCGHTEQDNEQDNYELELLGERVFHLFGRANKHYFVSSVTTNTTINLRTR